MIKEISHLLAVATLALGITSSALAANKDFDQCREFFANGTPPSVPHQNDLKPRALCFSAFAILHSGKSRTPIYVAERLNRQILLNAHIQRKNIFFADARLPSSERAELDDYKGSGLERGHMAPAADMATSESMAQCFSLANIVPQFPISNHKSWLGIEKATRKYIMRATGDVYVITGPVFDEKPQMIGEHGVWVPRYLFKLVYDSSANKVWAHWIENSDDARVGKPIDYEELVRRTGIEFFPDLKR